MSTRESPFVPDGASMKALPQMDLEAVLADGSRSFPQVVELAAAVGKRYAQKCPGSLEQFDFRRGFEIGYYMAGLVVWWNLQEKEGL